MPVVRALPVGNLLGSIVAHAFCPSRPLGSATGGSYLRGTSLCTVKAFVLLAILPHSIENMSLSTMDRQVLVRQESGGGIQS